MTIPSFWSEASTAACVNHVSSVVPSPVALAGASIAHFRCRSNPPASPVCLWQFCRVRIGISLRPA